MNNETKMKEWLYRALRTAGQTAGAIVIANFAVWIGGVHDVSSAKNVIFGAVATVLSGVASALMNMNKASVTVIDDTMSGQAGSSQVCTGSSEPVTSTVEARTGGSATVIGVDLAQPGVAATQTINGEVVTNYSGQSESTVVSTDSSAETANNVSDANAVG